MHWTAPIFRLSRQIASLSLSPIHIDTKTLSPFLQFNEESFVNLSGLFAYFSYYISADSRKNKTYTHNATIKYIIFHEVHWVSFTCWKSIETFLIVVRAQCTRWNWRWNENERAQFHKGIVMYLIEIWPTACCRLVTRLKWFDSIETRILALFSWFFTIIDLP